MKLDLSRIKVRLDNIHKKATRFVSFEPSEIAVKPVEYYMSARMSCLENEDSSYPLDPTQNDFICGRNIFAYDESTQDYRAMEGDLLFCSSALVKIEQRYEFNLAVLPYFITSMGKFRDEYNDEIRYTEEPSAERNRIMIESKTRSILEGTEPHSIVLIDGPLVGGMASQYMRDMDNALRERDCIPLYFVKNSDSRLVLANSPNSELARRFNSDFHWATYRLKERSRSAFFKYADVDNPNNVKVFAYMKTLAGVPQRVEMHSSTYERYSQFMPSLMNLLSYFYVVQGDHFNPQVRPIAIAEKYAREGIKILNIPALLARLGFHPTINQIRFG